jgi:hypothetical protein
MSLAFSPTRPAARVRLAEFLGTAAPRYGAERNFVRPGHPDVSRLSPWVQKRLLTEQEIVAATLERHAFPSVEKFLQEVWWRTYWKGWLEQRPAAWTRWRETTPRLLAELPPAARATYDAAIAGRTGLAGFDDWARELTATGYLHNHARMWFASIWIFTLRLPWELGADFFWRHLLDGDAASNTLSWRWVAGLQTAGKTYVATAANIARYTEGRVLLPETALAREAALCTEAPPARVALWTPPTLPADPAIGLWLHPEDLVLEQGELAALQPRSLYARWPRDVAASAGWNDTVIAFTSAALADGAARAHAHFNAPVATGEATALATDLAAWAEREGVRHVVAFRPFVGPWLEAVPTLERTLAARGVTLNFVRRAWDAQWFPQATRGYFPFWETVRATLGR